MTQKSMLRAEVCARALRASQNRKEDTEDLLRWYPLVLLQSTISLPRVNSVAWAFLTSTVTFIQVVPGVTVRGCHGKGIRVKIRYFHLLEIDFLLVL
jgi:hypothetical protein